MRKRKCELLQAGSPAAALTLPDPDRFKAVYRDLLQGAAQLPPGSLATLTRNLAASLVRGPDRRDILKRLADHLLDEGAGLQPNQLARAWQGLVKGLRTVSGQTDRLDLDLHRCLLERILQPAPNRVGYQLRAALSALWDGAFQPAVFTAELRNEVLNQIFAAAHESNGRNMYSACSIASLWLCNGPEAERHREAVVGTLVRESLWLDESTIAYAAAGVACGLGGNRICEADLAWLVASLAHWQAVHPEADWAAIMSGLEVQLGRRAFDDEGRPRLPRPAPASSA